MKTTTELFDFVLLLFILALMLPFMFGVAGTITDISSWGFIDTGDKTMKLHSGDVLTYSDLYTDNSLTAAEIVLMTRVHSRDTVAYSNFRLPGGDIITVTAEYPAVKSAATYKAQSTLDPTLRYTFSYDYETELWILN